jgi:peptidyl-prolyl cis-trans isomerase D
VTDEEMNSLKDQVWNNFIQNKLVSNEAEKIGLTVTDEELQNMLREGTNPMLMQTPFVNRETGRFDVTQLTQFINEYKKGQSNPQVAEQYQTLYRYWQFIEKTLRQQTLAMKYQTLLSQCLLSNPVSAKAAFANQNVESTILLASFPYSSVNDKDVLWIESECVTDRDKVSMGKRILNMLGLTRPTDTDCMQEALAKAKVGIQECTRDRRHVDERQSEGE